MLVPWSKTSYSHKTTKRKRVDPLSFYITVCATKFGAVVEAPEALV